VVQRPVCKLDLEGIVAKQKFAPYIHSREETTWVKILNPKYSKAMSEYNSPPVFRGADMSQLKTFALACLLAGSLILFPGNALSQTYNFTTVDVPNAISTICTDVSNGGTIVGFYVDPNAETHGFILISDQFTLVDFPGATGTLAYGLNDLKEVVGWYTDTASITHGFLLSGGKFSTIDEPKANGVTNAWSINNSGEIVGAYDDLRGDLHGFTDVGGTFTTLYIPAQWRNQVHGIAKRGQFVGTILNYSVGQYGFQYLTGGYIFFRFPGGVWTSADRINDNGEVVGFYGSSINGEGPFSGYTLQGGVFTGVMFPDSIDTQVHGVNDSGSLVGQYTDSAGVIHGFLATP